MAARLELGIRNAVLGACPVEGCIRCRRSCFEADAATDLLAFVVAGAAAAGEAAAAAVALAAAARADFWLRLNRWNSRKCIV